MSCSSLCIHACGSDPCTHSFGATTLLTASISPSHLGVCSDGVPQLRRSHAPITAVSRQCVLKRVFEMYAPAPPSAFAVSIARRNDEIFLGVRCL